MPLVRVSLHFAISNVRASIWCYRPRLLALGLCYLDSILNTICLQRFKSHLPVVLSFVGSLLCFFHHSVMEKTQQYVSRLLSLQLVIESTELALANSLVHPFVVVTTLTSRGQ